MRLIDADATILRLLDASEQMRKGTTDSVWLGVAEGLEDAVSIIKAEMPTIEPVKHGKWITDNSFESCNFGDYQCFECGEWQHNKTSYCPACGAKMDGGKQC